MSPKQTMNMTADGSWDLSQLATAIMDYEQMNLAKLQDITPEDKSAVNDVTLIDDRPNPRLPKLSFVTAGSAATAPNPAPDKDKEGKSKVFQGVIFVQSTKTDIAGYR